MNTHAQVCLCMYMHFNGMEKDRKMTANFIMVAFSEGTRMEGGADEQPAPPLL